MHEFKILHFSTIMEFNRKIEEIKSINSTVLQRISWNNFVYVSFVYIFAPIDRVLCSFVIKERISISRSLTNFTQRSIKRIYLIRPPTPRYSSTWDVSNVTDYLGTLTPLSKLSLKSLTLRTVMLCALATAQRELTMCALDLRNKIETSESIKFLVTDRLKTSRPGKSVEVCITATDVAEICPVRTLREYIVRTESLRLHDGKYQHKLFLSFVKPHNPVTTATIARWIKTVMHSAGIDTSVFKAHSV